MKVGFQARRTPTGITVGTLMGVSAGSSAAPVCPAGSGRGRSASAGPASDLKVGFQARRTPTGITVGTLMGVSAGSSAAPVCPAGSGRGRSASAGPAAQRASRRTRGRTERRYLESAVRARCADGFQDAAGDEVRNVGAVLETGAHFGRGDLGQDRLGTAGAGVAGALDGDDA